MSSFEVCYDFLLQFSFDGVFLSSSDKEGNSEIEGSKDLKFI